MANFKTHYNVGLISGLVASASIVSVNILSPIEGFFCLFLWLIGSISPDIDAPNSTPIKIFFHIISIIALFSFFIFSIETFSLIESILISLGVYLLVNYVLPKVFSKLSRHRGIIHSIPFAIALGLFLINIFYHYFHISPEISLIGGVFFSFGFLVHLILDEAYSVDLSGARLKKSFGTALKLYQADNPIGTIVVYIAVLFQILIIPPYINLVDKIYSSFVAPSIWLSF